MAERPAIARVEVPPEILPRDFRVPADLEGAVGLEGSALVIFRGLHRAEIQRLRGCDGAADWQVLVDEVQDRARAAETISGRNHPTTRWGRLLQGLDEDGEEAWRGLIEDYRTPVRKVLHRQLTRRGRPGSEAEELADAFFSWFFAKRIHHRVRCVEPDGSVNHFRRYLGKVIRTYLNEELERRHPKRQVDAPFAPDEAASRAAADGLDGDLARELAREQVHRELDLIRQASYTRWAAAMLSIAGMKGSKIVEALREHGVGSGPTASRRSREGLRLIRDRLLRLRLPALAATPEDAAEELSTLAPELGAAILAYAHVHAETLKA